MQTLAGYLLQANVILLVLGLGYALLLRKETFYQLNRFILGGIILVAFLLPLSPAPSWLADKLVNVPTFVVPNNHTADISHEPIEHLITESGNNAGQQKIVALPPLHQVQDSQGKSPTSTDLTDSNPVTLTWVTVWDKFFSSWFFLGLYGFIFLLFFIRLLGRLMALSRIIGNGEQVSTSLIHSKHPITPFSFGSFIVLNPQQYEAEMLEQIIRHERVHVQQWHTLDIMIAELLTIVCWFNPMSWWLSKTIRLNLEYIADEAVLQSGIQRKSYQYNLLKISHPEYKIQLANNFNHSLLKNRIIMMNAKKSPFFKLWKYTLLLPLLLILFIGLNIGTAQNSQTKPSQNDPKIEVYGFKDQQSFRAEDRSIYETDALNSEEESAEEERAEEARALQEEAENNAHEAEGEREEARALQEEADNNAHEAEGEEGEKEIDESHDGIESDILGDLDDFYNQKEDVYVIIRPGLERHDFEVLARQLEARGVETRFSNQNYNNGRLTNIKVSAKIGAQRFTEESNFKDGQPIVIYITHDNGQQASMSKGIPNNFSPKIKDLVRRVTGIFFVPLDDPSYQEMTHGKYKFKTEAAAKSSPNIYVVINQNTTQEQLKQMKKDLEKEGLYVHFPNIDVCDKGLKHLRVKATDGGGFNASISTSFDCQSTDTDGKIYIYRMGGEYGMGHGEDLENNRQVPNRVKKILKNVEGYFIGSFSVE